MAALVGLVGGCAGASTNVPAEPEQGEYRIGVDDVVEVAVFRDHDLSRTLPVRPDGRISLPLLGDVQAAGLTTTDLEKEVAARLAPFVDKPAVAVIVREINSQRFFVVGQVAHPGVFPLRGRVTVLQALAQAGGLGEFADENGIVLLRRGKDRVHRYSLRWDDLVAAR
ncbi:MAG TPA: polysaccharide biosynthesis/export family protein, partial [Myxococcales bacterium]|nr:polysaccharide biosynthesis/export family protein [Myxococcales bacterium]